MAYSKFLLNMWLLFFLGGTTADYNSDSQANQVLVQFDLVQQKDWPENVKMELRRVVANFSGLFCRSNFSACNIQGFSEFTVSNVVILSDYPKVLDVNSLVMLYVALPANSSTDRENIFVLRKEVLASIIKQNRVAIQQALLVESGESYEASYRISFVDHDLVLEVSDQTLNMIITPIACAVVLLMTMVILGLEFNKRRERKAEVKAMQKKRKQSNQSEPVTTDATVHRLDIKPFMFEPTTYITKMVKSPTDLSSSAFAQPDPVSSGATACSQESPFSR